jgi:hypothetical protein
LPHLNGAALMNAIKNKLNNVNNPLQGEDLKSKAVNLGVFFFTPSPLEGL